MGYFGACGMQSQVSGIRERKFGMLGSKSNGRRKAKKQRSIWRTQIVRVWHIIGLCNVSQNCQFRSSATSQINSPQPRTITQGNQTSSARHSPKSRYFLGDEYRCHSIRQEEGCLPCAPSQPMLKLHNYAVIMYNLEGSLRNAKRVSPLRHLGSPQKFLDL
jgi:hypothetical protein